MFKNPINRKAVFKSRLSYGMIFVMLSVLTLAGLSVTVSDQAAARGQAIGLNQFQQLWDRSDKAVADGKVSRSYIWGPTLSDLLTEPYAEGGSRQVQYFDKTRMEQTSGRGVSNGLLAKEMIAGLVQLGDNSFKSFAPNTTINIAGDQSTTTLPNPTYATFRKVATIDPKENLSTDLTNKVLDTTINRDGTTATKADLGTTYNLHNAYFVKDTSHNIPDVFWTFLNQSGTVFNAGAYSTDRVFDWVVAMGLPISEGYWSRAVVAGKEQDVLVQAFERRVLTFTPGNPAAFQVEMGNVGQHYYQWRQSVDFSTATPAPTTAAATIAPVVTTTPPVTTPKPVATTVPAPRPTTPPPPPQSTGTIVPATQPSGTPLPAVVASGPLSNTPAWQAPLTLGGASRVLQPLFAPAMKIRPTDGVAFVVGESRSGTGSAGFPPDTLLLGRSDYPGGLQSIDDSPYRSTSQAPHLTFAPDGTAYVVYRYWPDNYRAYMRTIRPDGSLLPGIDVGRTYHLNGGAGDLDFPDVVYSNKSGKLILVGEIQTSPDRNGIGYGESTDGGKSWTNIATLGVDINQRGLAGSPHACIDNNDNVHLVYIENQSVDVRSRINGQWQAPVRAADGSSTGWNFRGSTAIACGQDGFAYAIWDGPNSFGIARFLPGTGWQTLSNDVFPKYDARVFGATVSDDGRLWLSMGYFPGRDANPAQSSLVVSTDRGSTFTAPQSVIAHNAWSTGVDIQYSSANGHLYYVSTFGEPRETLFTITK